MSGPMNDYECSYFTFSKVCDEVTGTMSICNAKPVVIKSGKCLFHTLGNHDHDMDWVDCYAGCIKHDRKARRLQHERERRKVEEQQKAPAAKPPVAVPSVARLEKIVISRPPKEAEQLIFKKIADLFDSRPSLSMTSVSGGVGYRDAFVGDRMRYYRKPLGETKRSNFSFTEVCKIFNYIREWDKEHP